MKRITVDTGFVLCSTELRACAMHNPAELKENSTERFLQPQITGLYIKPQTDQGQKGKKSAKGDRINFILGHHVPQQTRLALTVCHCPQARLPTLLLRQLSENQLFNKAGFIPDVLRGLPYWIWRSGNILDVGHKKLIAEGPNRQAWMEQHSFPFSSVLIPSMGMSSGLNNSPWSFAEGGQSYIRDWAGICLL